MKAKLKNYLLLLCLPLWLVMSSCEKDPVLERDCKKDEFPSLKQLQGTWTELNKQSFQHQLHFDYERLYFVKQNTVDTFIFRLDNKEQRMFLRLKSQHIEIETQHQVIINKQRDEIAVWSLFISNTFETKTTFRKD